MTTKIALVADSHFDETSRFEECIRIHNWIADDAAARGCSAWLHAGDVYERRSTPRERMAAASWVQRMAEVVGPGVIARGNHDNLGCLPLLGRLDTNGRGVTVVEDARVVTLAGVAVAALAWPQKARILAMMPDASHESGEQAAAQALRHVLLGLGGDLAEHDGPKLLLAHAMVRGSMTSTGQPLVGADLELGLEDLGLCRADAYLLGHIHLGQQWEIAGAPVIYPGSPRRTAFGETEEKGYVIVELDKAGLVSWERIPTPATKMILINAEVARTAEGEIVFDDAGMEPDVAGAEVRLRYEIDADLRVAARAAADERRQRMIDGGAVAVKIEEVVRATTKARAPEVARAATLEEKLDALWQAQSFEPGERRVSLCGKLREIESQEAGHAA